MPVEKKRQKVHIDILFEDLETLDWIAAKVDLKRTDIIRMAIREFISNHPQGL